MPYYDDPYKSKKPTLSGLIKNDRGINQARDTAQAYWDNMNKLQQASLLTNPVPVLSDVLGLLGDGQMYAEDPYSRTPGNYAMTGLGMLPFVPPLAGAIKPEKLKQARGVLEKVSKGERQRPIDLTTLTDEQFNGLNVLRQELGQPPMSTPNVIYKGRHHYNSRSLSDGYSIDDLLDQLESAYSDASVPKITNRVNAGLLNPAKRDDGYGNKVNDLAAINVDYRTGKPEAFSVIPKGDKIKPKKRP